MRRAERCSSRASCSAARARRARSSRSPTEGAAGAYTGTIGAALLELSRRARRPSDRRRPRRVRRRAGPSRSRSRGSACASSPAAASPASPARSRGSGRCARSRRPSASLALVAALDAAAGPETHTTNLVAVDADGNACVLTTSLGLGSGDWLPGARPAPEQHARRGRPDSRPARAGHAHAEHDGAEPRASTATGSRSRSAPRAARACAPRSSPSPAAILDEGLDPQDAVDRAARPSRRAPS